MSNPNNSFVSPPKKLLQNKFDKFAEEIIKQLQKKGHDAYLVGGCIRDQLINIPAKDSSYYFFIIGFLGSFTTMSAFTHQTIIMFNSNLISAVSYIMLTIFLSIFATYCGTLITR